MKTKITIVAIVVLVAVAIGLGFGLISLKHQAEDQHAKDVEVIHYHSNQLNDVTSKWEEEKQVNLALEKDMAARKVDIAKLSNDLSQTSESLSKTEAALKVSMEETAKRDAKIAELETEKQALDKQAVDLKGAISDLEVKISDTQKKLDTSEGDKVFLQKELQRLMAEKAELERRFNDLAVLREQVHNLKEELSIARRLAWFRQGLFSSQDEKGAQRLMQGAKNSTLPKPPPTNNYELNVEVKTDGSVKVIPPATNAPPPAKQ